MERVAQEREGPVVDEDLVDPSILSKADFWSQEANWKSIHELLARACKNIELKVIHSGPAAAFRKYIRLRPKVAAEQSPCVFDLAVDANDYPVVNLRGIQFTHDWMEVQIRLQ